MTVHHWDSLTEAQKLTQSMLVPGVIEEDIKRNNMLDFLPVALATGTSVKWNRESTVAENDVSEPEIGEELTWTNSIAYDQQDEALKRKLIQRILDDFVEEVYGTINNYETQMLWETKKALYRRIGDDLIYDDKTYGSSKQMKGLHQWAVVQTGTDLDIDNGEAGLSLHNLRLQIDAMKHGCDYIFMPPQIARRMDEAYEEAGFASLKYSTAGAFSLITRGIDSLGKPILYFAGIPIIRTDYLEAENANTGVGSDARAKYTSGDRQYSVFCVKRGNVFQRQPGLMMALGNKKQEQKLYEVVYFPELENYDAAGLRVKTYCQPLLGSKLCLGRIYDIEDAAITA